MYENSHENPELIWNDQSRDRLAKFVKKMAAEHKQHLLTSPDTPWAPSQEDLNLRANLQGELVISGIYIRLFIANPGWVLRKPREFLIELMENVLKMMGQGNSAGEHLETLTTALVKLLEAQPPLLEVIPATGYIGRILSTMSAVGAAGQKPGLLVINQLSRSSGCAEAVAKCDTAIESLKRAMSLRRDLLHTVCETFYSLFEAHHDSLVKQALTCGLIQELLSLLDSALPEVSSPSGCKALIVKTLKAMQVSLAFGDDVSALLNKSKVWAQYAQQKHDLFLTDRQNAGYLTANPGVAGYLTSSSSNQVAPVLPPPMTDIPTNGNNDSLL